MGNIRTYNVGVQESQTSVYGKLGGGKVQPLGDGLKFYFCHTMTGWPGSDEKNHKFEMKKQ